tara:strand:+ start:466 stop:1044 length:579 start_codon:yes stop_codon:yes gene_type:complete
MTVRIFKPEVNIRSKLTELDFDRVPYQKMPVGSVIQTVIQYQRAAGTSNENETSANGYQPTTFMVDITPKFPNSIMKITAAVNHKNSFNGYYHTIAVFKRVVGEPGGANLDWGYRSLGDDDTGSYTQYGQGTIGWGAGQPFYGIVPIEQYDKPNTTSPMTYRLYHRSVNSNGTVRTGENGAEEFMAVQEIRQ